MAIIPFPRPKNSVRVSGQGQQSMYKGEGEIYNNGTWVPVKASDLHVCPCGLAHATRALPGKELMTFNILTPAQPKGGHDRVMISE
jgi:hypothetical protein